MKKKFLQKIANYIYNRLEKSKDVSTATLWYNIGLEFNRICMIEGVYLK